MLLRRACAGKQVNFESYNFGVGGYNTAIEAVLLRGLVLGFKPDLVVVKYGIDDAEPPLFAPDAATGQIQRVLRWYEQPGAVAESRPPENFLFRLRLAGLYWQARQSRRQSAQMISYFRSLLRPENQQWRESRAALQEILRLCRQEDLPCIVVFFPLLYELNRHYPFAYAHEALRRDTEEAGGIFVDLLPKLKGKEARRMWVHPSDHHPNEACHRIAAEAIAQKALSNAAVLRKIDEAAKR
jgi:lysophospholipase L1-like esterase